MKEKIEVITHHLGDLPGKTESTFTMLQEEQVGRSLFPLMSTVYTQARLFIESGNYMGLVQGLSHISEDHKVNMIKDFKNFVSFIEQCKNTPEKFTYVKELNERNENILYIFPNEEITEHISTEKSYLLRLRQATLEDGRETILLRLLPINYDQREASAIDDRTLSPAWRFNGEVARVGFYRPDLKRNSIFHSDIKHSFVLQDKWEKGITQGLRTIFTPADIYLETSPTKQEELVNINKNNQESTPDSPQQILQKEESYEIAFFDKDLQWQEIKKSFWNNTTEALQEIRSLYPIFPEDILQKLSEPPQYTYFKKDKEKILLMRKTDQSPLLFIKRDEKLKKETLHNIIETIQIIFMAEEDLTILTAKAKAIRSGIRGGIVKELTHETSNLQAEYNLQKGPTLYPFPSTKTLQQKANDIFANLHILFGK